MRPQFGVSPGGRYLHHSSPGENNSTHKGLVLAGLGGLDHWFTFASKNGFFDSQLECLKNFSIARYMLTGIKQDDIIGNQIPDFDLLPLSITYNGGCGLEQAFEGNISALGFVLLNETQNGVQYDDHHNDGKVAIFANGQRDGRGDQDDVNQRVLN